MIERPFIKTMAWFCFFFLILAPLSTGQEEERPALSWSALPELPGTCGLGGPFVGVHNEALIVAGGANFPSAPPWEGGAKIWHDDVFVLEKDADTWRTGYKLERALAYGASISTDQGIVLIGGCDAEKAYSTVSLLNWDSDEKRLSQEPLTPLPAPSSFLAAGRIGDILYVAAGQRSSDPADLEKTFWALDLAQSEDRRTWIPMEPWPGPARIKAVTAVQSGGNGSQYLYLLSGERPTKTAGGKIERQYLSDAYRFDPAVTSGEKAWKRIAPLPHPTAAGCALSMGQSHVLIFSGSTGVHIHEPIDQRPEFPRDILAYHTITDTWVKTGDMPQSVVTTTACWWKGAMVIPSGEIRPGVRTPMVQRAEPVAARFSFGWTNYTILILYLVLLVAMGWFFSRREKSTHEFFLAGKRIPWWAAGLSIYATQLSAITFVATPAVAYATNWLIYPGYFTIFLMAPVVVFFYLPFFRRLNLTTPYEYLEKRFNVAVRLFGSASFIVFQLGRMAIVVYLPALALTAITGMDIYLCIVIMGILATVYTVLGGMEAVIWTDVIQVVVLLGGFLMGLLLVIFSEGGPGAIFTTAMAEGKLTLLTGSMSFTDLATWSLVLGSFALQFGPYTTDQAVVQRYMTTKDERSSARSIWLNGIISIPTGFIFFAMGTCLYIFFKNHPDLLTLGMQNDQVFPLFIARKLPPGISGLIIAGIFAASMSSLDSSMHSIATVLTTDFYQRFKKDATDRACLRLARWIIIALGVLTVTAASALARFDIKSLFLFFQGLLGLLSSGLAGVFILAVFTQRANAAGALTGAVASTALLFYITRFTNMNFYLYAVIGIAACVIVGYLTSIVIPGPSKDLTGLTFATRNRGIES